MELRSLDLPACAEDVASTQRFMLVQARGDEEVSFCVRNRFMSGFMSRKQKQWPTTGHVGLWPSAFSLTSSERPECREVLPVVRCITV